VQSKVRASAIAGLILAATLAGGCTVRPMLATTATTFGGEQAAALPSVSIAEVNTRYGQEVRNHLIFLLNGGAGQPANPAYRLNLNVTRSVVSAVQVQSGGVHEPTAGSVQMTGRYTLVDAATGKTVATGTQQATASFDRPQQEFAVVRAERDAENRAARELAEFIRLSLAQDFVRISGQ